MKLVFYVAVMNIPILAFNRGVMSGMRIFLLGVVGHMAATKFYVVLLPMRACTIRHACAFYP